VIGLDFLSGQKWLAKGWGGKTTWAANFVVP
jgi:hypothetical protein